MVQLSKELQAEIDAIQKIPVIANILEAIVKRTGMGFAAIARVTDEKWVACAVLDKISFGLAPGEELLLESTICNEIRDTGKLVVIDHVDKDPEFAKHHTPAKYGFQSYISVPIIRKDNTFFGTLCAIDPNPHQLKNDDVINMFTLYADLIAFHLSAMEQVEKAENQLKEEQQTAELRDSFIAILGHDLRNPLGAVSNSAQLLLRMPLDDRSKKLVSIIKDSSYRMNGLIENVLDFARGKLGAGIQLNKQPNEDLTRVLQQVVTELQTIWPKRSIEMLVDLKQTVSCDPKRIAQLFSNLLGNALSHSPDGTLVHVNASSDNGKFILSVSNEGPDIDPETLVNLFQPFFKGPVSSSKKGLGLGLYIASEIARAHEGSLSAESHNDKICFTLQLPHC
ncbi:MAG: sensor histidine kinase [Pedobacter sp.]|nr:MAG: sensor histidine kinase [Pedobacter sp.]